MDFLIVAGVCFVIWKLLDSNSAKQETEQMVTRTTVITEKNGIREVQITTTERFASTSSSSQTTRNPPKHQVYGGNSTGKIEKDITGQSTRVVHDQPVESHPKTEKSWDSPRRISQSETAIKYCPKCMMQKSPSQFRKNSKTNDGLTKWCAFCLDVQERSEEQKYKICPNCGKNRRITSFYSSLKHRDGLTKWCKYCLRDR
jgi:hypothetical protein